MRHTGKIMAVLVLILQLSIPEPIFAQSTIQAPQASSTAPNGSGSSPSGPNSSHKQEMLNLFDSNHNGILDPEEKEEARQYKRQNGMAGQRRHGRRARRGSRRGRNRAANLSNNDCKARENNCCKKGSSARKQAGHNRQGSKAGKGRAGKGRAA